MSATNDVYEPWRRQGFWVRPWQGDRSDGSRFLRQYLEQAGRYEADTDWTHDEVLLGKDGGGDAATAPAFGAPVGANGEPAGGNARDRTRRLKTVSAKFLDHILSETAKSTLKAANAANEYDARAQFVRFRQDMCDPTDAGDVMDLKADINGATILATVGYHVNSIIEMQQWYDYQNARIEPIADRLSSHDTQWAIGIRQLATCGDVVGYPQGTNSNAIVMA